MKKKLISLSIAILLTGCASSPDKIEAAYVSPSKYKSFECTEIRTEMEGVAEEISGLYNRLKEEADNDAVQMGVGLVLFFPALFFLEGGDGPEASEYARLKGEYKALTKEAKEKECDVSDLPASPEAIIGQENKSEKQKPEEDNFLIN